MDEGNDIAETSGLLGEDTSETDNEVNQLREALKLKEAEASSNYDKLLRHVAEFENFKKRSAREKEDFIKYAAERLVKDLLPVVDNLERALDHSGLQDASGLAEGVEMTLKQFIQCLSGFGVVQIKAVGERFDPERHEAIMQMDDGDYQEDTVIKEHQKGYMIYERLLRPSMVTVARGHSKPEHTNCEDAGQS